MINTDIIISINVYKSILTLRKQLNSIQNFVLCNYIIILNCDDNMYNILKDLSEFKNLYINPEIINKERYDGSLTKGIVSNMLYATNNFDFKYFLILSGRTIFYKNLKLENLDILKKNLKNIDEINNLLIGNFNDIDWHWSSFKETELAKYYLNKGYKLYKSDHEGLCFGYIVINNILNFIKNNIDIMNNIYNYKHCVEEFALQTISYNEINNINLEYGFIYIGNGIDEQCDMNAEHKYTCKILYLD